MPNVYKDRVQVTTTTTGTGTYTVGTTPATGCRAFTAFSDGDQTTYCVESTDRSVWEINEGVVGGTGTTLTRGTLIASSTGSAINWTAGTRNVYCCPSAGRYGDLKAANNLSDLASVSAARTNLGLGTLATQSGTFSGTSSGTNTGDQTLPTDATITTTDVTTNNASTTKHGWLPKLDNVSTNFLNGQGGWSAPAGGVTGFTGSQNTSSPNNTVNASRLLVSAASTDADFVMQPKGTGAILGQLPDSTTTGGNKRGANAVDLQTKSARTLATQVASGDSAVICGGQYNTSSGDKSFVGGGFLDQAQGTSSVCVGGLRNVAGGAGSTIGGGARNYAYGTYSTIPGGVRATTRSLYGIMSIASGQFGTPGDAQRGQYILRCITTNGTATTLTTDQSSGDTTNQVVLPNNSSYTVRGIVNSHRTDAIGTSASWSFLAAIRRGANAASTTLVGAVSLSVVGADAGAMTWVLAITADTTNGCLKIAFTGEAAKTIRTVAVAETVEVTS